MNYSCCVASEVAVDVAHCGAFISRLEAGVCKLAEESDRPCYRNLPKGTLFYFSLRKASFPSLTSSLWHVREDNILHIGYIYVCINTLYVQTCTDTYVNIYSVHSTACNDFHFLCFSY